MKKANRILTVLIFIFLYVPMAVLIVASFNTGKDITQFEGFTLRQYARLFQDRTLLKLLGNSLLVSILASLTATVFGTVASLGIYNLNPRLRKAAMTLTNIPMTNPDIVTGVSLSLLFVFVGTRMLGQRNSLTFWTLLIAHITFDVPYVILSVLPKLRQLDPNIAEAAQDLGATNLYAFFKVVLPELMPGIVSGMLIAFTMSIDDFLISYFTAGSQTSTLSMVVYSMVRRRVSPEINALSTLMFLAVLVLLIIINLRQGSGSRHGRGKGSASPAAEGILSLENEGLDSSVQDR